MVDIAYTNKHTSILQILHSFTKILGFIYNEKAFSHCKRRFGKHIRRS